MEKQKINNYTIAADKLRIFTQKLEKIEEMTGPGHPVLNDLIQDYESTRAYVHKACAGIREKLLAGEKAPEDIYKGRDKGRFKDMIIAEWKKAYPKDEILSVRFHSADFQRTRNKRWNDAVNQWQYTDVSALAVSVIVRTDDVTATIFPAFINKDNQDGRISAGVHTKYGGYVVREILAKNI